MKNTYNLTFQNGYIKIYINDLLHVYFKSSNLVHIQTWVADSKFAIEYTFREGENLFSEYDEIDKWKEVIKLLDKIL